MTIYLFVTLIITLSLGLIWSNKTLGNFFIKIILVGQAVWTLALLWPTLTQMVGS